MLSFRGRSRGVRFARDARRRTSSSRASSISSSRRSSRATTAAVVSACAAAFTIACSHLAGTSLALPAQARARRIRPPGTWKKIPLNPRDMNASPASIRTRLRANERHALRIDGRDDAVHRECERDRLQRDDTFHRRTKREAVLMRRAFSHYHHAMSSARCVAVRLQASCRRVRALAKNVNGIT